MSGEAEFCWSALAAQVLHPIDVQIIEALLWVEGPLSTGDFARIFGDERSWGLIGHHLRRLARLDAIELAETPTFQNFTDVPYRLITKGGGR